MTSSPEYNDGLLVLLINEGHENAFEFVFREYYSPLCNYLSHFIRREDVIEQTVQDVFINIWDKRKEFSPKGSIKSYLFRAVKNSALNYLKHESVKQKSNQDLKLYYYSEEENIEKQFEQEELLKLIDEGISLLPEKCREVFLLVKFSGLTYKETASILNISNKTVENQMGKALKSLRDFLLPSIK